MFSSGNGVCLLAHKRRTGLAGYLKSPWEARWLVISGAKIQYYAELGDDTPRGEIDLSMVENVHVTIVAPNKREETAPSSHQVDLSFQQDDKKDVWKLSFETQEDLMKFLSSVHAVLETAGQIPEPLDVNRFEHDFQTADHIYRWEMIVCPPVIYPIQIHGIVLEAGRNCVVVADFGLTGYGRKKGSDFNHDDDRQDNIILEQWHKLRPTEQNQRLHISTLTDPHEIRKWFKANYDESALLATKKIEKFSKFMQTLTSKASFGDSSTSNHSEEGTVMESTSKTVPLDELPKADPRAIVLARAHFLLENEEVLPSYHVFFSNSECIAVWCKTGRWSTLQTAVFLATNSVGGAKSATLATLGVAAAHAVLAPVVAVGGLIWVSAPMVILKKSREKWEKYTMRLTDAFWQSAPPSCFVEAIKHWSGLCREHCAIVANDSIPEEEEAD